MSDGAAIKEGTSCLVSSLIDYFAELDSRADSFNGSYCPERCLFDVLVDPLSDLDFGANVFCCARARLPQSCRPVPRLLDL